MPYLDFNLRCVAKLRQVSIKTARDWRDGGNQKWDSALTELTEQERKTGKDIFGNPTGGFFDIDVEIPDIQETPEMQRALAEIEAFALPPV